MFAEKMDTGNGNAAPAILKNSIGMEFVLIPAGEFQMGSNESDTEMPVHNVEIKDPFYLGRYPVTQREWIEVMDNNPSRFKDDDRPVECISWDNAQKFVSRLNEMEDTDIYRLPSEAEWEFACKAGSKSRYYFGDNPSDLGFHAWYSGYQTHEEWNENIDSIFKEGSTHPVGMKGANPWGLYDMHGNVWEWVQDEWHENYEGAPVDGSAWVHNESQESAVKDKFFLSIFGLHETFPKKHTLLSRILGANDEKYDPGPDRVRRGGSWCYNASYCRSSYRQYHNSCLQDYFGVGFRVLRML